MDSLPLDRSQTTGIGMGSNPPRKVRIVAKIRGFSDHENKFSSGVPAAPWISVHKPNGEASHSVSVSFADPSASRSECYELDGFYDQNDSTDVVFSREVKPLISGMLDGCNATIIACGARGSGKSYLIQGTDKKPGLAAQAMAEILLRADENGRYVTISFYEVYQDHVIDLLDPKRSAVSVLENALGKIQLKGLSKVPVKSISEFHKLYFSSHKALQKTAVELPRRSHKGLIVHLSSCNAISDSSLVGKMNFVDLAGYEDGRRTSIDGSKFAENAKINKSLYALHNIVFALNANESHVPYRESKLTRVLQDSLGVRNKILMITCLNPSFCRDSMYMVKLASRSCQSKNRSVTDSTMKSKSVTKQVSRSQMLVKQSQISKSSSASIFRKTASRIHLYEKKVSGAASVIKERKLFDEATHSTKFKKTQGHSKVHESTQSTKSKKEKSISVITNAIVPLREESSSTVSQKDTKPISVVEKESFLTIAQKDMEPTSIVDEENSFEVAQIEMRLSSVEKDIYVQNEEMNHEEVTPLITGDIKDSSLIEEGGQYIDKENKSSVVNEGKSPPLSERLRELSNNLRSLMKAPLENQFSSTNIMEPKTPILDHSVKFNEKRDAANLNSPWETFSMRSSGMKESLVQEFLRFLNTATKEELKGLKGIGEKRATYILELRAETLEPFQNLDDLKDIGLSGRQIKGMMKNVAGGLFN